MFASIRGKSVHYTKSGSGRPVFLLVHGWGGSARSLALLAAKLSESATVYTVDLPGFGSSENPEASWGIEEYADILSSFMKANIQTPFVYFGHSFGGALGIYLASRRSDSITKLILAAPSYLRKPQSKSAAGGIIAGLPLPQRGKLILRKILYKLLYPRSDILAYPHLESNYRAIITRDLTPLLAEIKTPTLILWGDKDKDTPVSDGTLLHKKLPSSKLVVLGNASHNFPLIYPDLVIKEIEKFL